MAGAAQRRGWAGLGVRMACVSPSWSPEVPNSDVMLEVSLLLHFKNVVAAAQRVTSMSARGRCRACEDAGRLVRSAHQSVVWLSRPN